MPRLRLRHGSSGVHVELPDSWQVDHDFAITGGRSVTWPDLVRYLESPVGTPPLREMVRRGQRVCVVVQDHTRPGPTKEAAVALLNVLAGAGVRDCDVTVLVGVGTHRVLSAQEMRTFLGDDVVNRVRCLAHNYRDRQSLVMLGTTPLGTPVWVNREVAEADFVIGVGSVVPHFLAGFAGGAKVILPGVSGLESIAHNHFEVAKLATGGLYGNVTSNPVRQDMEAAAALAGLKFTVNLVPDQNGLPVYVVAGHPVHAHRDAVSLAAQVYTLRVSVAADVVIANSAPFDVDLNQAAKARSVGALALRRGGSLLWLGGCEEGVGFHGLMEDCSRPTLLHDAASEEVYFYSRWLNRKELERVYGGTVRWAQSLSEVVGEMLAKHGSSPRVIVLRAAPLTLVVNEKGAN